MRRSFLAVLLWAAGWCALPAEAATNRALGGIGGIANGTLGGGDGTGTAQITLLATDLSLVKQARDLSGAVLADGATVAVGQIIYFVLYVDNSTPFPAEDLQLTDALTEAEFAYVPGSLEGTTLPSGSSDAALWAASWAPLSDDPGSGDDIASAVDTGGDPGPDRITVGAVPAQTNRAATVEPLTRRAIRFRVQVN